MNQERLLNIIRSAHMSEKAAIAAQERQEYVFEVCRNTTKSEIKGAVEALFNVNVKLVRVMNYKGKPKRFGSMLGHTKAWKKAYVTLQDGQKIDLAVMQ